MNTFWDCLHFTNILFATIKSLIYKHNRWTKWCFPQECLHFNYWKARYSVKNIRFGVWSSMPKFILCPLYVEGQYITVCIGLYQFTLFPSVVIKSSPFHSQKCFGLEEREHRDASWMPVDVTSCWSTNSSPLPPVSVLKPYFPASLEGVFPCDWILANEMLADVFWANSCPDTWKSPTHNHS